MVPTQLSDDSDISSVDTNSDSLKSEDVFNADLENFTNNLDGGELIYFLKVIFVQ